MNKVCMSLNPLGRSSNYFDHVLLCTTIPHFFARDWVYLIEQCISSNSCPLHSCCVRIKEMVIHCITPWFLYFSGNKLRIRANTRIMKFHSSLLPFPYLSTVKQQDLCASQPDLIVCV